VNETVHQDSNDNGVRIVNFATPKNLVVKSTMFPHHDIHKYAWTSPDGKTRNQIGHILIDRRWHSSKFDVQSFRGTDCDTSKQAAQMFDVERFYLRAKLVAG